MSIRYNLAEVEKLEFDLPKNRNQCALKQQQPTCLQNFSFAIMSFDGAVVGRAREVIGGVKESITDRNFLHSCEVSSAIALREAEDVEGVVMRAAEQDKLGDSSWSVETTDIETSD